ncbi:MAG TPA: ORF6N domain-containing protein [Bacteroidia bacterium]|nr:ORF6N domain-containing protein [Bacteroidia bacterium]
MQLQVIKNRIYEIRGHKVMLDFDLAELYCTETKILKQSVKRNIERFPEDFMFELTKKEWENLRCNFSTSKPDPSLRSQIVTSKRGGLRYMPFAFTEQGVAMLSGILNSDKAIEINIAIMRAFVLMRNYALSHKDLTEKLKKMESKYNQRFGDIEQALTYLIQKDEQEVSQAKRKRIGFKTGK